MFFGAEIGQVGVIDKRRTGLLLWENKDVHSSRISDLSKIGKSVISGDNAGLLMKWDNVDI